MKERKSSTDIKMIKYILLLLLLLLFLTAWPLTVLSYAVL